MTRCDRGFTMIELLVVITIISILIGMTFGIMNMLIRQRKKVETKQLMQQISGALTDYLATYPILGITRDATSSDFVDSPWTFIGRNAMPGRGPSLGEMRTKYLASGPAIGPWNGALNATADQILDGFTTSDHSNHFVWAIVNGHSVGGGSAFTYTDQIWLRSTAGTPADPRDDLIMRFTLDNGQWTSINYVEATTDPKVTAPAYFW
jgi:prepilin-type N-terminal cleavage/methylation domain-containing protein